VAKLVSAPLIGIGFEANPIAAESASAQIRISARSAAASSLPSSLRGNRWP
jgi:hypothetical protein